MKNDYDILIKFIGGTIESHPVSSKSSQTMYYDWVFRTGPFKDTIKRISTFSVNRNMKFDEDWNLLMPVAKKIIKQVKPFTEERKLVLDMRNFMMDAEIKEVYKYALKIIKMLNNAKTEKSK